jgi:hypothetical protein
MRSLIDLSQKRARAGRAGGKIESFAGSKRDFAGSKPVGPPQAPEDFDVLAGLDAFL